MPGWTNRGKYNHLGAVYRGASLPTNFYIALVTSAAAPGADTNTFTELTEIANGHGYTTGGQSLDRNSTDFDTLTEDDGNDRALVQLKDIVWTATGGSLPASGDGARYAVLLDDNGTIADREVWHYWDLTSDRSVSDGQSLTLQDAEIRINET